MRRGSKVLAAVLAAMLIAIGLVACGGDDDGTPTTTAVEAQDQPSGGQDSGSGSEQFLVEGGDNSIPEFGEEAGAEERDAAADALHGFLDARAEGEWAAACSYVADSITKSLEELVAQAKQIEDMSCAGVLGKLTDPRAKGMLQAEAEHADVASLRVEDSRAFIIYRARGGAPYAIPMTLEGDKWKVASLAGTPLS